MTNDFKQWIRDIKDFPKEGIIFRDITTLLSRGQNFKDIIDVFATRYAQSAIDKVVAIDARGFIFGGAIAYKLGAGFVPVRKKGKLPYKTVSVQYELEYGTDTLCIHEDGLKANERVLIVDDLLATGGTAKAVCDLVNTLNAKIVELAFAIELSDLCGRQKLQGYKVFSQIIY
ncbi:MAG: adenine phosphoribosyltransferase [Candidatus Omnitrophica bacterium]|nr:adenine phosphoribosyltransferase [Candidatus Omnitrophota bacterium]